MLTKKLKRLTLVTVIKSENGYTVSAVLVRMSVQFWHFYNFWLFFCFLPI